MWPSVFLLSIFSMGQFLKIWPSFLSQVHPERAKGDKIDEKTIWEHVKTIFLNNFPKFSCANRSNWWANCAPYSLSRNTGDHQNGHCPIALTQGSKVLNSLFILSGFITFVCNFCSNKFTNIIHSVQVKFAVTSMHIFLMLYQALAKI